MKKHIPRVLHIASTAALLLASATLAWSQTLTHRYSFNETAGTSPNFSDSVGGPSWAGTLVGTANLDGSQMQLDGGGWATLPAGIISSYSQVTIEFWATFYDTNPTWTRTFAFGDQTGNNENTGMDYCHYAGGNWQNMNIQSGAGSGYANNPGGLNGQTNVHVTVVVDPPGANMYYFNGTTLMSTFHNSVPPLNTINDTTCLLGKSLFNIDSPVQGSMNEFRVYSGVISSAQLAINDAAGPDNYVSSPGALQAVHLASPDNPLTVNQNSLQLFTGDFLNVSNVNLAAYGGATFVSSNTSVLTVSSSGLVTALTPGTTKIVALFGGMSVTNTLTVVAVPAVLAHRYSFNGINDATDSIGGANGTFMGNATNSAGQLVLDGTTGTYLDLPGNIINIATNRAVTIEAWVTFGDIAQWCRLFDFGADGGSTELYFAPSSINAGGNYRISENISGGRTFDFINEWTNKSVQHLTCIFDPPSATMAVYKNGQLDYAVYNATAPLSLVATNLAVIGRSLVAVDPYMPGSIDELRIYHGALTPQEIALTEQNGPSSTVHDPGTLNSIALPVTVYPAYSPLIAPTVLANYANLANFSLLPNNSATATGLTLTSSDPTVLQVLANNMIKTFRPGSVTLTASYFGKTASATVTVKNVGTLAHRYSFTTDASDSAGTLTGSLQGSANVSGGALVLDGGGYLDLGPAVISNYDAVTIDTWVTFNAAQTWARLWYFGDDRANEFYAAPAINGGNTVHRYSTGFPVGGNTADNAPAWQNQSLHLTYVFGNGAMESYTNGLLHTSAGSTTGRMAEVGNWFSWIGKSPYADPLIMANVDEFRIYKGRLAPDEIQALDVIGPNALLSTTASVAATRSGNNVVLSWPVAAAGFSVQSRSSLNSGSWTTLPNVPVLVGNTWQVTLPATGTGQFYRVWR